MGSALEPMSSSSKSGLRSSAVFPRCVQRCSPVWASRPFCSLSSAHPTTGVHRNSQGLLSPAQLPCLTDPPAFQEFILILSQPQADEGPTTTVHWPKLFFGWQIPASLSISFSCSSLRAQCLSAARDRWGVFGSGLRAPTHCCLVRLPSPNTALPPCHPH